MLGFTPQAIVFDLDGVILDSEVIYRAAWQQSAADLGYSMSANFYSGLIGQRDVDCTEMLIEAFGSEFPVSLFLIRGAELSQRHLEEYGMSIKPGLMDLLSWIDHLQLRTAVATSTERNQALISLGNLASRFDVIVAGDDVSNGKPAPDILFRCAKLLNISPRDCLLIEDAEAGVEAACAAGMPVIIVPDLKYPSPETASKAACVCATLHEVKELLVTN